jgi:hypothetical protein
LPKKNWSKKNWSKKKSQKRIAMTYDEMMEAYRKQAEKESVAYATNVIKQMGATVKGITVESVRVNGFIFVATNATSSQMTDSVAYGLFCYKEFELLCRSANVVSTGFEKTAQDARAYATTFFKSVSQQLNELNP